MPQQTTAPLPVSIAQLWSVPTAGDKRRGLLLVL